MYRQATVFDMMQVKDGDGTAIATAKDIADRMADNRKNAQEGFWVITLNQKNKIISIHMTSLGTLTASLVHPREVFRPAIADSAARIALCHNHPSGDVVPSREDKDITRRLKECGTLLGIEVLDHVIIGYGIGGDLRYSSMAEDGIL